MPVNENNQELAEEKTQFLVLISKNLSLNVLGKEVAGEKAVK